MILLMFCWLTGQAQQQNIRELQTKIEAAQSRGDTKQAAKLEVYLGNNYLQLRELGNATRAFQRALSYSDAEAATKGYAYWGLAKNGVSPNTNYLLAVRNFQVGQLWELYYKALDDAGQYFLRKNNLTKAQESYEQMQDGALTYGYTDYARRADAELENIYNKTGQQSQAARVRKERSSSAIVQSRKVAAYREREQTLDSVRVALDSLLAVTSADSAQKEQLIAEKRRIEEELMSTTVQKEKEVAQALQDKARAEASKEAALRQNYIIAVAALLIITILSILAVVSVRANRSLKQQKQLVDQEREKSEALLLNILPAAVADELKKHGRAQPQYYDSATVIFTDFKGFTQVAEKLSPQDLIQELEEYFLAFDEILERHNLEKIKTIGDAYMCAGGLPIINTTHAEDAVKAGLDMQRFMARKQEEKSAQNKPSFQLRVGIHTGPLVAGVVGRKKFAYDIWGDTVNVAARMEQSGEPDRVNISGETYERIKDKFNCTYRGQVAAKNKGNVDMYFVEGIAWNAIKEGRIKL
ncbi:MAG: adenylate/guanylate cyclase domain-containing protein [Bernardetiaceae bacterium]